MERRNLQLLSIPPLVVHRAEPHHCFPGHSMAGLRVIPPLFSGGQYREGLIGGLEIKTFPTWLEALQWAAQHLSPEQLTQPRHLPKAENGLDPYF